MMDDVQITGQTVIKLDNVAYTYQYDEYAVIKQASCVLGGGVCTVLCDTQSGKTTLCKLIAGLAKTDSGKIFLDGLAVESITAEQRGILYLSGTPVFFENQTVAKNIAYPLRVRKVEKARQAQIVADVAERLGLTGLLERKIKHCTQYERRLIALARGLTVKRRVVLFDDFFAVEAQDERRVIRGACNVAADGDTVPEVPSVAELNNVLALFDDALKIVVTSDKRLLIGNSVIFDGGKTVFCGNEQQAREYACGLDFLFDRLQ